MQSEISLKYNKQIPRNHLILQSTYVTSHEKAAIDAISLKLKHRQHIPWESSSFESQRVNAKEKAVISFSNPSSVQDSKALAQLNNSYENQHAEYIQEKNSVYQLCWGQQKICSCLKNCQRD